MNIIFYFFLFLLSTSLWAMDQIKSLKNLSAQVIAKTLNQQSLTQLKNLPTECKGIVKKKAAKELINIIPGLEMTEDDMQPFTTKLALRADAENSYFYGYVETDDYYFNFGMMNTPPHLYKHIDICDKQGTFIKRISLPEMYGIESVFTPVLTYKNWTLIDTYREKFLYDLATQSFVSQCDQEDTILGFYDDQTDPLLIWYRLIDDQTAAIRSFSLNEKTNQTLFTLDSRSPRMVLSNNRICRVTQDGILEFIDPFTGLTMVTFQLPCTPLQQRFQISKIGQKVEIASFHNGVGQLQSNCYILKKNYPSKKPFFRIATKNYYIERKDLGVFAYDAQGNILFSIDKTSNYDYCQNHDFIFTHNNKACEYEIFNLKSKKVMLRFKRHCPQWVVHMHDGQLFWTVNNTIHTFDFMAYLKSLHDCSFETLAQLMSLLKNQSKITEA